jgi:hypothetical protein
VKTSGIVALTLNANNTGFGSTPTGNTIISPERAGHSFVYLVTSL